MAQLLLLAKAIAIAVGCSSNVLPQRTHGHLHAGIAALMGSICAALLLTWCQLLLMRWLRSQPQTWPPGTSVGAEGQQPLLTGQTGDSARSNGVDTAEGPAADKESSVPPGTVTELLRLAIADTPILAVAFTCGLLAAVGTSLLPYLTGKSIDAAGTGADAHWHEFSRLIEALLATAAATAVAASGRGSLFTLVSVRMNTRLRDRLFAHLLTQACFHSRSPSPSDRWSLPAASHNMFTL